MKNYRAYLSLALAAALALSLTACGPKDTDTSKSSGSGSGSASGSGSSQQQVDPVPDGSGSNPAPDGSGTDPAPDDPNFVMSPGMESLRDIRQEMVPSGAIAAVFFLGTYEGEPLDDAFYRDPGRQDYWEGRPFMNEITPGQYAQTAGMEVYCIVPADPMASVKVTEWDESGEKPVAGKVLYESKTGDPFFVQGNISDIMPNLAVTIKDSYGAVLDQYHPAISLKDGSVALPGEDQPLVLDMTGQTFPFAVG